MAPSLVAGKRAFWKGSGCVRRRLRVGISALTRGIRIVCGVHSKYYDILFGIWKRRAFLDKTDPKLSIGKYIRWFVKLPPKLECSVHRVQPPVYISGSTDLKLFCPSPSTQGMSLQIVRSDDLRAQNYFFFRQEGLMEGLATKPKGLTIQPSLPL